jgi:hypothetical protein
MSSSSSTIVSNRDYAKAAFKTISLTITLSLRDLMHRAFFKSYLLPHVSRASANIKCVRSTQNANTRAQRTIQMMMEC